VALKILLHKSSYQHSEHVELVKDAVHYAVDFFDLRNHNWRVEIHLVPSIESECDSEAVLGQHHYIQRQEQMYSKIYISCGGMYKFQIVHTLFHEITHLKQVLKGQLAYPAKGIALWKGKSTTTAYSTSRSGYWNLPYEKDARLYANILLWSYTMKKIKEKCKQIAKWFKKDRSSAAHCCCDHDREPMSKPGDKDYEI
jgi:hypothetical protein